MNNNIVFDIIGYVGSALVLISFLMASVLKLRIINIMGSLASVIYSLLIGAYPTLLMNGALICINIYYIVKILKHKNIYHVVDTKAGDAHLAHFFEYYHDDIAKYFPQFNFNENSCVIKFLYCENVPASVFVGKKVGDGSMEILLDYATPAYRDCSAGKYVYESLSKEGITKVYLRSQTLDHDKYLKKIGFVKTETGFEKTLA